MTKKLTRRSLRKRTFAMLAHYLNTSPDKFDLKDDLRDDWEIPDEEFGVLRQWINGPISDKVPGFFQDVKTDVILSDLYDPDLKTVKDLAELIWEATPEANRE